MPNININKANRQVCDVDIRELVSKKPFLYFDDANVTTVGFSSDTTYALARGARAVGFDNPIADATMTIEAQVKPFKLYALLSDGVIDTTAIIAKKDTIQATTAGTLTLPAGVQIGTVFVYALNDFGGTLIEGTVDGTTFTATKSEGIVADEFYEVGYLIKKSSGVHKVSINDRRNPKSYYVTMNTVEKSVDDVITPYIMTGYNCRPQKSASLSFSSAGDPATVTITFNCMVDKDGNLIDMVEFAEPDEV